MTCSIIQMLQQESKYCVLPCNLLLCSRSLSFITRNRINKGWMREVRTGSRMRQDVWDGGREQDGCKKQKRHREGNGR